MTQTSHIKGLAETAKPRLTPIEAVRLELDAWSERQPKPVQRAAKFLDGAQSAVDGYDHWKATEPDDGFEPLGIEQDDRDFCVTHGYEHMKQDFGNPIAYCAECERERENLKTASPYGPMCRDPKLCAGKGYCPRDPTCGD